MDSVCFGVDNIGTRSCGCIEKGRKGECKCLFGPDCYEYNKPKCEESEEECVSPATDGKFYMKFNF